MTVRAQKSICRSGPGGDRQEHGRRLKRIIKKYIAQTEDTEAPRRGDDEVRDHTSNFSRPSNATRQLKKIGTEEKIPTLLKRGRD